MSLTKLRATALIILVALTTSAYKCGASKQLLTTTEGIDKVENKLGQVNNALNALAKTNRELYRSNVINKENRQTVATIINKTNSGLQRVADRVYQIQPDDAASVEAGKINVVAILRDLNVELGTINFGPPELRAAAQAVITLINEAIDLTNRVRALRSTTKLQWNSMLKPEVCYA